MENIEIRDIRHIHINEKDFFSLYNDAGWTNYTDDFETTIRGIKNSLLIIGAFIKNKLAGFIRVIGDGETIIYIQDLIVLSQYKRRGIGKRLVREILERYKEARQKVLITDNNPESTGFYNSIGFSESTSIGIIAFIKIS